jgi:cytoskeletal protein CcmA (bactofilin family)
MIKQGSATLLSTSARLTGELKADDDVVLAGTFEGVLRTARSLQVLNTGVLKGEAHADSVVILGRVDGPVSAVERIELQPGAVVNGDLSAQRVRIHDDVVFNGHCRITGPEGTRKQYLLPAVVQVFGDDPAPQALARVQSVSEGLLGDFGFDVEVRAERLSPGTQVLRPIFRSRDPLAYPRLRERLRSLEETLQSVTAPEQSRQRFGLRRGDKDGDALQITGADGARALLDALAGLRNATWMVGPVILTRVEENRGPRLTVRVRQDGLPAESATTNGPPEPSQLLLSLQKVQAEVVRDLAASLVQRQPHASA